MKNTILSQTPFLMKFSFGPGTDMADFEDEKDKGKKDDHDSGPEEEEVPTRGFLKRQANMIVDAKSRSKRGTRRR